MKKKKANGTKKKKGHGILHGVPLEKGDTLAIIIAALTVVLPFALAIFIVYLLFAKLIFQF